MELVEPKTILCNRVEGGGRNRAAKRTCRPEANIIRSLAQIIATALLVYIFSFRNFAVGTTFSKTETIQTAVFGMVVLGETISLPATFAILISLVGVMMISVTITVYGLILMIDHSFVPILKMRMI